jgi:NhaP-type Na+/H+ or K+/H+ antiporter
LSHEILLQLTGILVLGILAQWMAWRVRLPSILLLLAAGVLAGPVTGWLHPGQLFGKLLLPVVSLSVAVILYEGGLNLKLQELRHISGAFLMLTTVGALVSWLVGTLSAHYILGFEWPVATLLGAILVVTGPTVIGPILRHLRLRGKVGALLKWEGIIIDPVGVALAVLVFSVIQGGATQESFGRAALDLGLTVLVGGTAGFLAAGLLIVALARYWVPDSMHNPVSLMLMFAAFTVSNILQTESGLLAVTVMGIVLANQRWVSISHVVEFKETLTVLLISCLFIVLSARLKVQDLTGLGWESFLFVAAMIFVARPLSVFASTLGSSLNWRERVFLSCMAPRGIVAAAVTSVFALSLVDIGFERATEMIPVVFLVVFVTVLLYGLSADPLARWLGLTQNNPQGILFIGADPWVRSLAHALHEEGCPVFLIDTDWENICHTRMAGLPCLYGSALADNISEEIDYTGLGRMIAVTSNNEVNSLACLRYLEDFGRQEVYQLPFSSPSENRLEVVPQKYRGRFLFGQDLTYTELAELSGQQPRVKKTKLTTEFDFMAFQTQNRDSLLPLFVLKPDGTVVIRTVNGLPDPRPGDLVISLVRETEEA